MDSARTRASGNSRNRAGNTGCAAMTYPLLAYEDEAFVTGADGRPVRMLAEYLAPLHALHTAGIVDTVVFFGSARLSPEGRLGHYYEEARQLAAAVTRWAHTLSPDGSRLVVSSG